MRRHYVYYRVRASDLAEVMQAATLLHARFGSVELLRRPETQDGRVTLMEIYAADDAAKAAAIEHDAQRRLAPWLVGERHVEVFEPIQPIKRGA